MSTISESIHSVKRIDIEVNEELNTVELTIVFDDLASASKTNRFGYRSGSNEFFGDVELEKEITLFLHESVNPHEFVASLGVLATPSL